MIEDLELSLEYINQRDPYYITDQSNKEGCIRNAHAFMVCFDWSNKESVESVKEWIEMIKQIPQSSDKAIYMIGINRNKTQKDQFNERHSFIDRVKNEYLIFNTYDLKDAEGNNGQKEASILVKMVTRDIKKSVENVKKRTMFTPLESAPEWSFKLVNGV